MDLYLDLDFGFYFILRKVFIFIRPLNGLLLLRLFLHKTDCELFRNDQLQH